MSASLVNLFDRIDALSLRERVLAGVATGFVLGAMIYAGFVTPAESALKTQRKALDAAQGERAAQSQQIEMLRSTLSVDPDAARKAELAGLRQQIDVLGQELLAAEVNLINPEQMLPLLRDLLEKQQALVLSAIALLPPESMRWQPPPAPTLAGTASAPPASTAPASAATGAPADAGPDDLGSAGPSPVIFRHAVEIEFQSDYNGALRYLRAIEAVPARLNFDRLELKVESWPRLRVRLRVSTLSLREDWIGV